MRFKSNVFKFIWRVITIKYLIQRQYEAAKLQKPLLAVFANDTIGSFINVDGVFEKNQLEVLTDFLNTMDFSFNSKDCIDVGANIGNHSLYFSDLFSTVISFEAHPKVFKLLEFNTAEFKNITCYNKGIGEKREILRLSGNLHNTGGSSFVYDQKQTQYYDVQVENLDSYLDQFNQVGLIKIDVEGMEKAVINGALGIISRDKPVIVFEQSQEDFGNQNSTPSMKILSKIGYDFFWIKNDWNSSSLIKRFFRLVAGLIRGNFNTDIVIHGPGLVPVAHHDMLIAVFKSDT